MIARIEQHLVEVVVPETDRDKSVAGFGGTLMPKYQKQLRRCCRVLQKHAGFLARPQRKSVLERIGFSMVKAFKVRSKSPPDRQRVEQISAVVLAVTFQRLLEDKVSNLSLENDLVLDALRRSTGKLENASIEELSSYVRSLTPEQLSGVVSNTKGIYHELLFVEMHNAAGTALDARVVETANFPGVDVQFILEDELIREVQLKAVNSPSLVYEHLERYPDIEIRVTEETSAMLDGIASSGLSNAILSRDVSERMTQLQGEGFFDEVSDGLLTSVFVTSGFAIWNVFKQKEAQTFDFKPYLANAGIAVGTASVIESAIALAGS